MKRLSAPSEFSEQAALCQWWAIACRKWKVPEMALFAIPNGAVLAGDAKHRAIQMSRLKATGLRPGVPDLMLAVPLYTTSLSGTHTMHAAGLFIEQKRKPNKPSEDQLAMATMLRGAGFDVCICYSADEGIRAISGYLNGQPAR